MKSTSWLVALGALASLSTGCMEMQPTLHYASSLRYQPIAAPVRLEVLPFSGAGADVRLTSFAAAFRADLERNGPLRPDDRAKAVLRLRFSAEQLMGGAGPVVSMVLVVPLLLGGPYMSFGVRVDILAELRDADGRLVLHALASTKDTFYAGLYWGNGQRSCEKLVREAAEQIRAQLEAKRGLISARLAEGRAAAPWSGPR